MKRDYESEILVAITLELDTWGGALRRLAAGDRAEWWARAFHSGNPSEHFRDFGIPYAPGEWAGVQNDEADRQGFSRAVRRLAGLRLVVAVRRYGSRLSHLQPTAKGLTVAAALVQSQYGVPPGLDNIAVALGVSRWATPEHFAAVATMQAEAAK